jgi:hypothetical protein
MENSGVTLLLGGIVATVFFVMGGVFNLKRQDRLAVKESDILTSIGNHVWSYLTPPQQEELANIDSLCEQEEWIEDHVDPSVMKGTSAEKVLVELANRGFISLGKGPFKRHVSAIDFIQPKTDTTIPESQTVNEELDSLEKDEPEKVQAEVEIESPVGAEKDNK